MSKDKPATGIMFEKEQMQGLYFNQSPTKIIFLKKVRENVNQWFHEISLTQYIMIAGCCFVMVSMRPIPLGPMMEKLSLTPESMEASRRFYIQTLDDHALSPDRCQEKLVRLNPPEGVFKIKGSDHSPFFSKPQSLHKILNEIAQIP
ncbi:putative methylesterase 14, chloroplastic [Datura stramonium]|uniref:Methylesterase 14, chloroplastic n=1 Tax=Datura stramonium TaxID=4076 RepID=A0ABS8RXH9_DATST|nr:putative methylesterase 14, chloroplastic [Datura stramonium]